MARPTKYDKKFNEQAYKLCLLGATDNDLADFFEVEEKTINNWKLSHPEFLQSIKAGKDQADSDIAKSLYERARGYEYKAEETTIENIVIEGKELLDTQKKKVVTKHIKIPPDATSMIFWLKNRQKGKWRDKHDFESASITYDLATLPPEYLDRIIAGESFIKVFAEAEKGKKE